MRRRSGAVFVLAAATLAASWGFGSRPVALVGIGLLLAALAARLWAHVARKPMGLERRLGATHVAVEGEDVRLTYVLTASSRLPPSSVHVREAVGVLGEFETPLRKGSGELLLERVPRGRYPFTGSEVVVDDPLGLERVVHRFSAADALSVVPRVVELHSPFSEAGRADAGGRRVLLRRPSGVDLHSVREYEHGESLRKVHWPTTARRGRLMVKELEDSPRDDLVVLLDCDAAAACGPRGASSFDEQVRVAGSLLRAFAARGKGATLVCSSPEAPAVRVVSLDVDWEPALRWLAALEANAERPLARVLGDERSPASRAGELLVVTAALEDRAATRLLHAAARGRRVSLVQIDGPTYVGRPASSSIPALLRLAAAGLPVAVVRKGDDLQDALSPSAPRRASA